MCKFVRGSEANNVLPAWVGVLIDALYGGGVALRADVEVDILLERLS